MVIRFLIILMLLVLSAGFVFFAANVLWLGTKEFFALYGPFRKKTVKRVKNNN